MVVFEVIALGFVCWLATNVVVESEMFRPIREFVQTRYENAYEWHDQDTDYPPDFRSDGWKPVIWYKLRYLVGCQLCTGIWVGLILAAVTPWIIPLATGFLGVILNGLLYKAIGHTVLIWQKYMETRTNVV